MNIMTMFTIEDIKAAHAKVKSGADFPNYVKELIDLGVSGYSTLVSDGNTEFRGSNSSRYGQVPNIRHWPLRQQQMWSSSNGIC